MRRHASVSDASDVFNRGAVAYISLFIFLVLRYVVTLVVCRRLMFYLIYTCVTVMCVLMCVVYL